MGYAYEDYCQDIYEREFCLSDIDFSCSDCREKQKELEDYQEGYDIIRENLEKILNLYDSSSDRNDLDIYAIHDCILKMCNETGVNYAKIKAVI